MFRLAHGVAADSLLALKIVLTGFDVATGIVLVRWLATRGDVHWSVLYWLNPLVSERGRELGPPGLRARLLRNRRALRDIHERQTHRRGVGAPRALDGIEVVRLLADTAVRPMRPQMAPSRRRVRRGRGARLPPVRRRRSQPLRRHRRVRPLLAVQRELVFRVASLGWGGAGEAGPLLARVTVGLTFATLVFWRARRLESRDELPDASRFVLAALLLLSPVVDAWYVLWILPVAVLTRSTPSIVFTWVVSFSYAWFYSPEMAPYFQVVEYAVLLVALGLQQARTPSIVVR